MLLKYPCSEQRPWDASSKPSRPEPLVRSAAVLSSETDPRELAMEVTAVTAQPQGSFWEVVESCGFFLEPCSPYHWPQESRERESKASEIVSVGSLDRGFFHFPSLFGTCLGDESTWQRVGWCGQPANHWWLILLEASKWPTKSFRGFITESIQIDVFLRVRPYLFVLRLRSTMLCSFSR